MENLTENQEICTTIKINKVELTHEGMERLRMFQEENNSFLKHKIDQLRKTVCFLTKQTYNMTEKETKGALEFCWAISDFV